MLNKNVGVPHELRTFLFPLLPQAGFCNDSSFPITQVWIRVIINTLFFCKTVEYCGSPEKEMSLNTTQHTVDQADRLSWILTGKLCPASAERCGEGGEGRGKKEKGWEEVWVNACRKLSGRKCVCDSSLPEYCSAGFPAEINNLLEYKYTASQTPHYLNTYSLNK